MAPRPTTTQSQVRGELAMVELLEVGWRGRRLVDNRIVVKGPAR